MKNLCIVFLTHILLLFSFAAYAQTPPENDWPQVQRDAQHTGYSPETLGTNFKVAWTYPFQPDRVYPQTQAIVYQGKVFVGTEGANGQKPRLIAINAGSGAGAGQKAWEFVADGPILNSAAADNSRVFFATLNGTVYALDMDGREVWKQHLSDRYGFSAAPVIAENKIMIGGHNGKFYAFEVASGSKLWEYDAGAPIRQTAAFNNGKAFFGTVDLYVHAINTSDGSKAWQSDKLSGRGIIYYWPVITQGKVIIRTHEAVGLPGLAPGYPFIWFGSDSHWSWLSQWSDTIAAGSAYLVPDFMNAQNTLMSSYAANPNGYTKAMFILDEDTGKEAFAVPQFTVQTMHGATTPPCIDREQKLVTPVMFIRSTWGRLDLSNQRITDVLYDGLDYNGNPVASSRGFPRGSGNRDENLNVTCTSNLVLAMHIQEGNANYTGAFDQNNRRWYPISVGHRNRQMSSNAQGGGANPASVSNGMIYHISWHELIARTTQ